MKTVAIIAIAKIGLVIAKQVVRITPNKRDDMVLAIVDNVYAIITKVKTGNFDVEQEVKAIGDLAIQLQDSEK